MQPAELNKLTNRIWTGRADQARQMGKPVEFSSRISVALGSFFPAAFRSPKRSGTLVTSVSLSQGVAEEGNPSERERSATNEAGTGGRFARGEGARRASYGHGAVGPYSETREAREDARGPWHNKDPSGPVSCSALFYIPRRGPAEPRV